MAAPDRLLFSPEPHESQPLKGTHAVITGTSRGIGAEIAVALAEVGVAITGNHVDPKKESKQGDTATRVQAQGVVFNSVLADIAEKTGREALVHGAIGDTQNPRRVDYLVLNAAGGLERGKPEDWAETINIVAQHGLIDQFLPYMRPGGKIIYVTSLWAHRYGDVKQLPAYGPVASTKHRFEQELRARIPALKEKGIDVGIVVGHVIRGTAAHLLFSRMAKEELARLEQMSEGGQFPDASDMGHTIKNMLLSGLASEQTIYLGGTHAEAIEKFDSPLTKEEVRAKLPMYSDEKLLVDTFELVTPGVGEGTYSVRRRDTEGHFTGKFEDVQLWRGVDQLESLAQTMGLTVLQTEGDTGALGVFRGVRGGVRFMGMIFPGDTAVLRASMMRRTPEGVIGNGKISVKDKVVMQAEGIDIGIIPDERMARRLVESQKTQRSNS